uniref:Endonuclease 8-like 3 n=1 Tax=Sinocyclocheilus anshuiensis TaxID=1608454 RepID=A0A671KWL9_9TELE
TNMLVQTIDCKGNPPVLVIQLTNDALCFFDTTVEIRLSEDCEQRVRAMEALDICSPKFSFSQAVEAVKRESERMLCDVLLDQTVLPGVGNIIKNEALFDSGLNPAVKVKQLKSEQVHHVVRMTRDFTLLFYKKNGSPLYKHYKVYKRPNCGQCSGTVTLLNFQFDSKLPTGNCLIGWAYQGGMSSNDHVAKQQEEEWACSLCTLINRPINKYCDTCMSPRPEVPKEPTKLEHSPLSRDLIRYPCNSFSKPLQEIKMNRKTAFGTTTLVLTNLSAKPDSASSPAINQAHTPETMRGLSTHTDHIQPNKRMKTMNGALSGGSMLFIADFSNDTSLPTTPCCKSHHRPCTLRVVTKEGENKGRQFYTCSLPRETQCNFFETALKLGPNNGRNFYTCPVKMGKQCNFFQWAENGPGISILPGC